MRDSLLFSTPLGGLFRDLRQNVKLFFREELELAKREMTEKISCYGRNATGLVVGGVVAYAGVIVLLGGLGILAGLAFQKMHMNPALANAIGLATVGLIVILTGVAFVLKALKAFSKTSLAPQKTIETIKHLNGGNHVKSALPIAKHNGHKLSIDQLKAEVLATEEHIEDTLEEIAYRTSPTRITKQTREHIETHPYTWSLAALGGGLLSSLLLTRRRRLRR